MMQRIDASQKRRDTELKKFFMVTPQQSEGMLHKQHYATMDNSRLEYAGDTSFPVVPLVNGYADEGEEVQVVTLTYGKPSNCAQNLVRLKDELLELANNTGVRIGLESVDVPFDDSVGALIHSYQLLVDRIDDGDVLHACITFGSKPLSLMLTMALQYGYRIKGDVAIECVVYGQMDRSVEPAIARIYDLTALTKLDELVRVLADLRVTEPERALKMALDLGGDDRAYE